VGGEFNWLTAHFSPPPPFFEAEMMNKLHVQQYLESHSIEELTAFYGISAKRHPKYPNLVMLKYNQIESPMGERIVQECRGLILNEAEGWSVVSRPYDKFFNYGEGHASPIDWPSARVYEKLDGSLMTLYWYADQWHVASSGLPDAGGPVMGSSGTFAELFWRVWNELGYRLPTDTGCCYMFELMTPHNRVVVPHQTCRIVLHGAREIATGIECKPEIFASDSVAWEVVRSYPIATLDDVVAMAATLKPMEHEGYVVVDKDFRRIKVKSPQYVAMAHMKDNFTVGRMLELVRTNEGEEFLGYFPELRADYERVRSVYREFCAEARMAYSAIRDEPTQKDFAMKAKDSRFAPVLFAMRNRKAEGPEDFIKTATMTAAIRLLGLKESPVEVPA
jgi:hypothetical protein